VLTVWDQHLIDPYLPRTLGAALRTAGFTGTSVRVLPLLNVGFHPDTFSAGLMKFITGFVAGRDGLTAADVEAWADDLRALGPDYFFSLNRYVFSATRP
jgi:arsenite methyltransferase